mmetsp:Transcript_6023/g.10944  ORF Transcript_6023/g.10944 Transcript_6023/m.10944 type:complete len:217 (+) Transcript_6023:1108-1758(+)
MTLKFGFSSSGATTEMDERRSSSPSPSAPPFSMTTASSSNSKSSSYLSVSPSSSSGGGGGGGEGALSTTPSFSFFLVQASFGTAGNALVASTPSFLFSSASLRVLAQPGTSSVLSCFSEADTTAAARATAAALAFSANRSSMALVISGLSLQTNMQPSPPTDISLLLSSVNFTPVTSSEWPATLPMHSPDMKSKSLTHLSIPAVATTRPDLSTSSL